MLAIVKGQGHRVKYDFDQFNYFFFFTQHESWLNNQMSGHEIKYHVRMNNILNEFDGQGYRSKVRVTI